MTRTKRRPPVQERSHSERISIRLSIAAMVVSLLAAVVTPVVTYLWLDPATKDYKERGFLLGSADGDNYDEIPKLIGRDRRGVVTTFINAGLRPLKTVELHVGHGGQNADVDFSIDGRAIEKVKQTSSHTIFQLIGSAAPGEKLVVRYRGPTAAGAVLITEHGDESNLLTLENSHPLAAAKTFGQPKHSNFK